MNKIIWLWALLFLLGGCHVVIEEDDYDHHDYGSYGWMVYDEDYSYYFEDTDEGTIYFETPWLGTSCDIIIDIERDYYSARLFQYDAGLSLCSVWYPDAYGVSYRYAVEESGIQRFWLEDLHPQSRVTLFFECDERW